VRPQGNILVDSPRFNPVLAKRIQELGGVKYMFLTHKWVRQAGSKHVQLMPVCVLFSECGVVLCVGQHCKNICACLWLV
jgi:hypothetical protein